MEVPSSSYWAINCAMNSKNCNCGKGQNLLTSPYDSLNNKTTLKKTVWKNLQWNIDYVIIQTPFI